MPDQPTTPQWVIARLDSETTPFTWTYYNTDTQQWGSLIFATIVADTDRDDWCLAHDCDVCGLVLPEGGEWIALSDCTAGPVRPTPTIAADWWAANAEELQADLSPPEPGLGSITAPGGFAAPLPPTIPAPISDHPNDRIITAVTAASNPDVLTVLLAGPSGHSNWQWFRLANGDLLLGTYPQGDVYEDVTYVIGI